MCERVFILFFVFYQIPMDLWFFIAALNFPTPIIIIIIFEMQNKNVKIYIFILNKT